MRRAGRGSIINTASFVASVGAATPQIAYTASKGSSSGVEISFRLLSTA